MTAREALLFGGRLLGGGRGREVALILAGACAWPVERLFLEPSRPLEPVAWERYRDNLKKRFAGVPLQYLLGEAGFWSLSLRVDPRVLVPRPETETLVETVLELADGLERPRIADVGTGSGCIGLALAVELPHARIHATDVSADALAVARENAAACGATNVFFHRGDLLAALPDEIKLNFLVSNPPYVATGDLPGLPPEVRAEPRLALDGGGDGLYFYRRLLADGVDRVRPGGLAVLELGFGQGPAVRELARGTPWRPLPFRDDLAGIERVAVFRREP